MTAPSGNIVQAPQIERNARNAPWNPLAVTGPAPDSSDEETPLALLAEVQMLRAYLCELLRKNQELRNALAGLPVIED